MSPPSTKNAILANCFAPVAAADAHLLILGSMPGQASLAANAYYAHPRNAFWPIMGQLIGALPALTYDERLTTLQHHRIALWDVLASCIRPGSLDANIDAASIEVNDFPAFLDAHPQIRRICFNGAAAEQSFRRYVSPAVATRSLEYIRLPSTSPAHAGMNLEAKLAIWRAALTL